MRRGAAEWLYLPLEILIRSFVRRVFRILGRPFEVIRADYGVSRRDECISTGRVRPRSAPRGPGDSLPPLRSRAPNPLLEDSGAKFGSRIERLEAIGVRPVAPALVCSFGLASPIQNPRS